MPPPKPPPVEWRFVKSYIDSELRRIRRVYRIDWYDARARISVHQEVLEELKGKIRELGGEVKAQIPARRPLVIVEADFSKARPKIPPEYYPAPPPRPPVARLGKEEAREYFESALRTEGVEPKPKHFERFEREWPGIAELPRERQERLIEMLAREVAEEEKRVPPPPPAPPAPPPARPPEVVPYGEVVLERAFRNPEILSVMLRHGARYAVERYGAELEITPTLYPELLPFLTKRIKEKGREHYRKTRGKSFLENAVGWFLMQYPHVIAEEGLAAGLQRGWPYILHAMKAQFPQIYDYLGRVKRTLVYREREYEYTGRQLMWDWMIARALELFGAEVPEYTREKASVFEEVLEGAPA